MHNQLRIVKGVQGAPGDVYTLESNYTTLNLLSGAAEGFALKSDAGGWNPAIAQPKSGLWYETTFTDGRTLFAGADQNVIETISLTLTAPDMVRLGVWMRQLDQMQADCLRFWEDEHMQYDPVFLWWWATGAPGAQFALIYQIQVSISIPTTQDNSIIERDVTITLEREPYWRGLPPGANPVIWTLQQLGEQPGLNYDYDDQKLNLIGDVTPYAAPLRSLVSASVQNRSEFQFGTEYTRFTQNHITIPAASIPGDAPALVSLAVRVDTSGNDNTTSKRLMLARRTDDIQVRNKDNNNNFIFANCLPAIQSTDSSATPATVALANDTGGVLGYTARAAPSFTTRKRLEITPTVNLVPAVDFFATFLNTVVSRGRFAIFMRCRQDSGSAGDITVQLRLNAISLAAVATPETAVPLQAGVGNTTSFPMMYMGALNIPNDVAAPVALGGSYGGTGLMNAINTTLSFTLLTKRSAGASKLYIADIIFMPIDEGFVDLLPIAANVNSWFLYDNTGYVRHGKTETIALLYAIEGLYTPIEIQGAPLTLTPQVDNHIFALYRDNSNESKVTEDIAIFVNIVPRWRYIRDV